MFRRISYTSIGPKYVTSKTLNVYVSVLRTRSAVKVEFMGLIVLIALPRLTGYLG